MGRDSGFLWWDQDRLVVIADRLFRLTKRHPELALELAHGRPHMPFPVMAAFRTWGDERLKMIADIASKANMPSED